MQAVGRELDFQKCLVVPLDLVCVVHDYKELVRNLVVERDEVSKLLGSHAYMEDELVIISECLRDMIDFLLLEACS